MKQQGEITLHLESLDQLIEPHPSSPFLKRRLREDAEKFIRDEAEKELRRVRRFGWRSLLIATVFLGMMILLIQMLKYIIPSGNFSSYFLKGLTILGWVALWRPGELLLYEWYPYKRDAKIYSKLERAEVQVIASF